MSEPGVRQGDFALKARMAVKMKNTLAVFSPAAPHLFIPCCQPPAAPLAVRTRACGHGFLSARGRKAEEEEPLGQGGEAAEIKEMSQNPACLSVRADSSPFYDMWPTASVFQWDDGLCSIVLEDLGYW